MTTNDDLSRARAHVDRLRQPPRLSWRTAAQLAAFATMVGAVALGLRLLHPATLPGGQDGRPYHHAPGAL